jgi:hypothetical protein
MPDFSIIRTFTYSYTVILVQMYNLFLFGMTTLFPSLIVCTRIAIKDFTLRYIYSCARVIKVQIFILEKHWEL